MLALISASVFIFWTLNRNSENPCITFPFGARKLSFDSSGKLLMILHDGVIDVREVKTGTQVATIDARPQEITTLTLDKQRAIGCFGTNRGEIGIFDARSFEISSRLHISSEEFAALALSTKNKLALVCSYGKALRIIQAPGGAILGNIKWTNVTNMTISADEELLALNNHSPLTNDELGIRKLDSLKEENDWKVVFSGFDESAVAFSFLGQTHVLAIAQPRQLSLWDFDADKELDRMHFQGIRAIAASDDGIALAVASYPLTLHIVQTNQLRPVRMLEPITPIEAFKDPALRSLAISPDAKYLAVSCYDYAPDGLPGHGKTKVWRLDKLVGK
jgi:WD40 repeat protein